MRTDWNDFACFAGMVAHGASATADLPLRELKSELSRHVAGPEERRGLRLIERSRRFRVTDTRRPPMNAARRCWPRDRGGRGARVADAGRRCPRF